MLYPLLDKFEITQFFGERPEYYKKYGMKGHNGIDFRVKFPDTPSGWRYCYAVMLGRVIEIGHQGPVGYGSYIYLKHPGYGYTIQAHLKKVYVAVGQLVAAKGRIGLTDNTGDSSGPHLHFGWRPENFNYNNGFKGYEDPLKFFCEK